VNEALVVHNCPKNFTGEALVLSEDHFYKGGYAAVTYLRLTATVCAFFSECNEM
jgi:hypothetical protein